MLPWEGSWLGLFGQMEIDLAVFLGSLFLLILVKTVQLLGDLRWLAKNILKVSSNTGLDIKIKPDYIRNG
jgi:CO dehydrogenase/acetyl-CoA synthase epsilon subunit